MPTRRLLADTLVMAALALALAILGWLVAAPLLRLAAETVGTDRLIIVGPLDIYVAYAGVALAFALPPVGGWIAALAERAAGRSVPAAGVLALYALVVALFAAAGIGLVFRDLAAFRAELASSALAPSITVDAIAPGARGAKWAIAGIVLVAPLAALRARRARAAREKARPPARG